MSNNNTKMNDQLASNMYREHILENYRNPNNFNKKINSNKTHTEFNSLCGDRIKVELEIVEDKIKDISFSGSGCAISISSMSLLSEFVKNKTAEEVLEINKEQVLDLMKIDVSLPRIKCVLIGLDAIKGALRK